MRGGKWQKKGIKENYGEAVHFEEYEQKCAAKLLAIENNYRFDVQVLAIVGSSRRKQHIES